LWIYFGLNRVLFDSWLPVSAAAKGLRSGLLPSWRLLSSVVDPRTPFRVFSVGFPLLMMTVVGFLMVRGAIPVARSKMRVMLAGVTLFPLAYFAFLSVWSDWPVWDWYFYPVPLGGVASIALSVGGEGPLASRVRRVPLPVRVGGRWVFVSVTLAYVAIGAYRSLDPSVSKSLAALPKLVTFAAGHPGTLAMGDCAGLPAFLIERPVIQLEGLVGDNRMLEHIRRGDDLIEVMRTHGVAYYVTTAPKRSGRGYVAEEPAQSGSSSPRMRGTFGAPVLVIDSFYYVFEVPRGA